MNVSRPFIERPVATTLLMVAVLLLGMLGYHLLSVSALPEVDYPTIQVFTQYPGASPDVVSSSITAPLERQLGEMPGLKSMNSTSSDGASVVTLQFDLSLSLDVAEQEVQAAINAAGTFLPANLPYPPVYSKVNPADAPVLTLSLTSDVLPLTKVEDLADTRLAQKISQITGVGLVTISGGQRPAVRVEANTSALNSLGLSLDDLRTSLGTANVNQAKGNIDGKFQAYSIGANDQLQSAEEYRDLVIAYKNGAPIRLSQIASSTQGPENPRQAAWTNSTPSIVAQAAGQSAGHPEGRGAHRPHPNHPCLGHRCAVRTGAGDLAGGNRDFHLLAQYRGHYHSRRHDTADAGGHPGGGLCAGVFPEQSDADGADHRYRFCGG